MSLAQKKCIPCEGGTPPLTPAKIEEYLRQLATPWEVIEGKKIRRAFPFENFAHGLAFVNKVGALAEEQDHHPDVHLYYRKVVIELTTHAVGGLSSNDFIMAAKIEEIG